MCHVSSEARSPESVELLYADHVSDCRLQAYIRAELVDERAIRTGVWTVDTLSSAIDAGMIAVITSERLSSDGDGVANNCH